jgi:hypothetical protein
VFENTLEMCSDIESFGQLVNLYSLKNNNTPSVLIISFLKCEILCVIYVLSRADILFVECIRVYNI